MAVILGYYIISYSVNRDIIRSFCQCVFTRWPKLKVVILALSETILCSLEYFVKFLKFKS
jgi:hypothetical protein